MKNIAPYSLIFSDDNVIVADKASGISVGGDRWDESKERLDKIIQKDLKIKKLFTVHRIDKETSGLVVFAKNSETHRRLSMAFEQRQVSKLYTVIVHGNPSWKETACDLALVPNGNKRHMTIIDKFRGKKSLTHFTCILKAGKYSVLHAKPVTGRIHQIRVHSAAIGHPVVYDKLYGKDEPVFLSSFKKSWRGNPYEEKPLLARLGLHAGELSFSLQGCDSESTEMKTYNFSFSSPLPRDMAALINQLGKL